MKKPKYMWMMFKFVAVIHANKLKIYEARELFSSSMLNNHRIDNMEKFTYKFERSFVSFHLVVGPS